MKFAVYRKQQNQRIGQIGGKPKKARKKTKLVRALFVAVAG